MSDTTERQELAELVINHLRSLEHHDAPYVDAENLEFVCVDGWFDMLALAEVILAKLTAHDAAIRADAWDEGAAKAMENGYLMRNGHVPNPYRTPKGDGE